MTKVIFQMIITVVALPVCAHYLEGIWVQDMSYALIAGVVLALIYMLLRPFVKLITKVFNFFTLGLLSIFIDAWLVQLCTLFMKGFFTVDSFWRAALLALIINAARYIIGIFFR